MSAGTTASSSAWCSTMTAVMASKTPKVCRLLNPLPTQARVMWRLWIHTECVEAPFGETINQPAVAAADVENSRAWGECRTDNASNSFHHRSSAIDGSYVSRCSPGLPLSS